MTASRISLLPLGSLPQGVLADWFGGPTILAAVGLVSGRIVILMAVRSAPSASSEFGYSGIRLLVMLRQDPQWDEPTVVILSAASAVSRRRSV